MQCNEFQQILQRRADGELPSFDERAFRDHARQCANCRELQIGFRLFLKGVVQEQIPNVSPSVANRVVAATVAARSLRRPSTGWLVAAALVGAISLWLSRQSQVPSQLLPIAQSVSPPKVSSELLFPELSGPDASDAREFVAFSDAVEPVSRLVRELGKSISGPVRPIAASTSQAMESLLKDIPEFDGSAIPIPIVRDVMGISPMKKMPGMVPSS
jgi:hypothetical protein